ncbi:GHKL domain-containing protein [Candidatus Falkowbacteria bacterium]|uniref:histidine kinase n=1 Tax=Candidatus Falkowbacteria bacterium CG10_big_fil_rev_8_21_14_0_10_37_18 TaxID=1974562 RepID=A0A2H0V935_9BACT|nr:GHKL domain-containing protein [Candidatus Falkowbacteria bacterium]NCQ12756.1 GHKL domain-containing protein [Candidatus Falkowbacteria bacterium]PIR95624.1 MAG: hypothetical protein COT93_01690 [Candidatus Falkowbacteria bacterium CG10_big_fil_rev_8_21_14_0_10_37_18]
MITHIIKHTKEGVKKILPLRAKTEESRRRELILNVLLLFSIGGFIILNLIRLSDILTRSNDGGMPIIYTLIILAVFSFFLWLSRRGKTKAAAWLLIGVYSLPLFYCLLTWGSDLPAAILLAILIITLSGILLGDQLILISTTVISLAMIVLTALQSSNIIPVDSSWHNQNREVGDAIANAVLLIIIAIIAWFFARENNRALTKAHNSKQALRQERDSLEIKVAARTQQLRQAEAEKINQLYRLAEFGRLSSGIFHDLINPLTAVSLNLEQIKSDANTKIIDTKSYLSQALSATHKMEGLIGCIKKQIQRKNSYTSFNVNKEIEQIIEILAYKSRQAQSKINFISNNNVYLYGDAIKFGQIIMNLIANSIEAGEEEKNNKEKKVLIKLEQTEKQIIITVTDEGNGIAPEDLTKIFSPFFSTKSTAGRGLGLGLSSTKNIVEKDFGGIITVSSELKQGSQFTVSLPRHNINTPNK